MRWQHAVGTLHVTELVAISRPELATGPRRELGARARARRRRAARARSTARCSAAFSSATRVGSRSSSPSSSAPPGSLISWRCRARTSHSCSRCSHHCSDDCSLRGRFGGGSRGAGAVRHDDAVGAVGAARDRDGVDRPRRRVPRASRGRAPRARARGDRAASRRSVPAALGRASGCRAARVSASRSWRGRSRRDCAGPRWIRETLGGHRGRADRCRAGAHPGVRLDAARRAPRQPDRGAARRAAHDLGARRRSRRAVCSATPRRSSRALLQLPTVGLLHAIISVADVASRAPVAVDGRAIWAIDRGRRRSPPRLASASRVRRDGRQAGGTDSVTRCTTSPTARS